MNLENKFLVNNFEYLITVLLWVVFTLQNTFYMGKSWFVSSPGDPIIYFYISIFAHGSLRHILSNVIILILIFYTFNYIYNNFNSNFKYKKQYVKLNIISILILPIINYYTVTNFYPKGTIGASGFIYSFIPITFYIIIKITNVKYKKEYIKYYYIFLSTLIITPFFFIINDFYNNPSIYSFYSHLTGFTIGITIIILHHIYKYFN